MLQQQRSDLFSSITGILFSWDRDGVRLSVLPGDHILVHKQYNNQASKKTKRGARAESGLTEKQAKALKKKNIVEATLKQAAVIGAGMRLHGFNDTATYLAVASERLLHQFNAVHGLTGTPPEALTRANHLYLAYLVRLPRRLFPSPPPPFTTVQFNFHTRVGSQRTHLDGIWEFFNVAFQHISRGLDASQVARQHSEELDTWLNEKVTQGQAYAAPPLSSTALEASDSLHIERKYFAPWSWPSSFHHWHSSSLMRLERQRRKRWRNKVRK